MCSQREKKKLSEIAKMTILPLKSNKLKGHTTLGTMMMAPYKSNEKGMKSLKWQLYPWLKEKKKE